MVNILRGGLGSEYATRDYPAYAGKLSSTSSICGITISPIESYDYVQIITKNNLISAPPQLTGILIAPTALSSSAANKIVPSVGNNLTNDAGATGWSGVTFDGVLNPTLPTVRSSEESPISDVGYDPGYLVSDLIPLNSVAPLDGLSPDGRPYFMFREHVGQPFSYTPLNTNSTDRSKRFYLEVFTSTSAAITAPNTITTGTVTGRLHSITGIRFFDSRKGKRYLQILCIGDSITQGYNSPTGFGSWTYYLEDYFMLKGMNITVQNRGWVGSQTISYANFGLSYKDVILPNIIFYSMYSPNDAKTQADMDKMYERGMKFARECARKNIMVIFVFLLPWSTLNLTDDNIRKGLIARTKAQREFYCIDATTVTGDGLSPEDIKKEYDSNDGIHANDAGNQAIAQYIGGELSDILIYKVPGYFSI